MDKISHLFKSKTAIIGSAAAVALIGGYYYYKNQDMHQEEGEKHFDPSFNIPNIPLHHSVAMERDEALKEGTVKYELLIILNEKDTYQGKVSVEFELNSKQLTDLYLDF